VGVVFAFSTGLAAVTAHEALERDFPTPHGWSWNSRLAWHAGQAFEDDEFWPGCNGPIKMYDQLLKNLENPAGDGNGLKLFLEMGNGDWIRKDDGSVGIDVDVFHVYDISAKDENWRRGYIQCLLALAKVAEKAESRVRDTKMDTELPKPLGFDGQASESHLLPVTHSAELFYQKLLATMTQLRGDSRLATTQLLDIYLSYSGWLMEQPGRQEHGKAIIELGVDQIIKDSFPEEKQRKLLEGNTKLENKIKALTPSPNSQRCLRALALYHVKSGDIPKALDDYIRLLSNYPAVPKTPSVDKDQEKNSKSAQPILRALMHRVLGMAKQVQYPPPPPLSLGNSPLTPKDSEKNCAAAVVRAEAAEVLFASAPSRRDVALNWTADAIESAHKRSKARPSDGDDLLDEKVNIDEREKCAMCAKVALTNWNKMVEVMRNEWRMELYASETKEQNPSSWGLGSLFGKSEDEMLAEHKSEVEKKRKKYEEQGRKRFTWAKKLDRDSVIMKLEVERWKIWTWVPDWVLYNTVSWTASQ
jgi:hypothetical protein